MLLYTYTLASCSLRCPYTVTLWLGQVRQEGYVDGDKLLFHVKSAGDTLASSLLSDLGADHLLRLDVALAAEGRPQGLTRLHGAGLRVLPVFVFCLEGVDEPVLHKPTNIDADGGTADAQERTSRKERPARLFAGSSPFVAEVGGDAVLVLQSEGSAPVPFYERSEAVRLPLSDVTQAVVAGLLQGMHGTTAPYHWWSPEQQDFALDLSWAHGYHPFAPFGFGGSEPGELLADVARRNAVASRAAAVAAALEEAARVLEDFAQTVVPSELLVAGVRTALCRDGASMKEEWGRVFEEAAASAGLPPHLIEPALDVHRLLHDAVGDFEEELRTARGASLAATVATLDRARSVASSILGQVKALCCVRSPCRSEGMNASFLSLVPRKVPKEQKKKMNVSPYSPDAFLFACDNMRGRVGQHRYNVVILRIML